MTGGPIFALLSLLLIGCADPEPVGLGDCSDICREVVDQCALPTWPTRAGCLDGCLLNAARGGDITSQRQCVELAECDLFALVECEHAFGPR
ncbi:MAG: hypothetical protein AAGA48_01530 [Myxococcota bacterium]